jgi:hypothetical protein
VDGKMRRTQIKKHLTISEQSQETCKHFTGVNFTDSKKCCKAGVNMASVTVKHDPPKQYRYKGDRTTYSTAWSIPCLKSSNCAKATCTKREFPTKAECEEKERVFLERSQNQGRARAAIVKETYSERGVSVKISCPICQNGDLHYSVAKCNGHTHAKCSTENCVCWME